MTGGEGVDFPRPNYCLYGFRVRPLYIPSEHNTPQLEFPEALSPNKLWSLSSLARVLYGFGITWRASQSFVPQNATQNEPLLAPNCHKYALRLLYTGGTISAPLRTSPPWVTRSNHRPRSGFSGISRGMKETATARQYQS